MSDDAQPWSQSRFLRACRREPVDATPVWFLRQAGRYMPEYRAIRKDHSMLEICKSPKLAAEVTLQPIEQLDVDAAILFADILLLLEPLDVGFGFHTGDGPRVERPVRTAADVDGLRDFDVATELGYVGESVAEIRRVLDDRIPLIGFAGAPFTVASYLIEGGSSSNWRFTKELMYRDPEAWHRLMARLSAITLEYLQMQVDAGAQALQLFDSWVGALSPADYREFVLPHSRSILEPLAQTGLPLIHFGTQTTALLPMIREAGGTVIGLDWRVDLAAGWNAVGHDVAVQGNLDPVSLFGPREGIERRARAILDAAAGRSGHIFNLGHGILQHTPVPAVKDLVRFVREASAR